MRDREGLQHQAFPLREDLELIEQAGLPYSRVTHHPRNLPVAALGLLPRPP